MIQFQDHAVLAILVIVITLLSFLRTTVFKLFEGEGLFPVAQMNSCSSEEKRGPVIRTWGLPPFKSQSPEWSQRVKVKSVSSRGGRSIILGTQGHLYESTEGPLGLSRLIMVRTALFPMSRIVAIACGAQHGVAITLTGDCLSWGFGSAGQLGHGTKTSERYPRLITALLHEKIVHGSCGETFTLVVSEEGRVFAWGSGEGMGFADEEQLKPRPVLTFPSWKNKNGRFENRIISQVCCGWSHSVALDTHGNPFYFGKHFPFPRQVKYNGTEVRFSKIQTSKTEIVILATNLTLWKCKVPLNNEILTASMVLLLADVAAFSCGESHVVALTKSGELFGWGGSNKHGQIGENNFSDVRVFSKGHTPTSFLSCGESFTMTIDCSPKFMPHDDYKIKKRTPPEVREAIKNEQKTQEMISQWETKVMPCWNEVWLSNSTKQLWQKGLPFELRTTVWPLAIGNPLRITKSMYVALKARSELLAAVPRGPKEITGLQQWDEINGVIDSDLPRTFPHLSCFDIAAPLGHSLACILKTFAAYRPDLGYVQGM